MRSGDRSINEGDARNATVGSIDGIDLSPQARSLWAKTGGGEEGNLWSPLYVHMADSALVARKLWDEWVSDSIKRQISDCVDGDDLAAASLVFWLAGIHDIGKATPGFQYKVPERAEFVQEMGLRLPSAHMVSHPPSHANMGEVILERKLDGRGWDYSWSLGGIVGSHHGVAPSDDGVLRDIESRSGNFPIENMGDEGWISVQDELFAWMFDAAGVAEFEEQYQALAVPQPVQVLISALVIMSDWIASNSDFFPLTFRVESWEEFRLRADAAWVSFALPSSWHAENRELEDEDFFHRRFAGLPENARLRPAQLEALRAALSMDDPGLLIIEAPMGNGKTEASLLCAEVMAAKSGAGGVAYLLPTMATSNAMFSRVEEWLKTVPDSKGGSMKSMQLLHSKAALNPDYSKLRSWGSTWMGDEAKANVEEGVVAHQWFAGKKRGLLSSFVVGTVDQLLMAALKVKHVQLRHLGLAGKVVVVDEVHAYDAYMNTYLDRILTWLGAYGVPTILLSATLPANRRDELIHAYRGRDRKSARNNSRRKDIPQAPCEESGCPAYPLITTTTYAGVLDQGMYRTCEDLSAGTNVIVQEMEDDDRTLVSQLNDLLSDGGCVCVLRDTVSRAQSTYQQLKKAFGASCVKLVHSRFIAVDRMRNDAELLRLLGPDSDSRPDKLIVVGTQVIEQSLDIDFDAMITDIAPIDLLLQRMGRLHRHQRGEEQSHRPKKLRQARCYVVGVEDWNQAPPKIAKGIDNVYPKALLWRSLLALRTKRDGADAAMINLPHDIAMLVELVYSLDNNRGWSLSANAGQKWTDALQSAEKELLESRESAQGRARAWLLDKPKKRKGSSLIGWLRNSYSALDDVRGRAAVRETDESIEVVAVQELEGEFKLLPWAVNAQGRRPTEDSLGDGFSLPDDEAARLAANCTVSLPPRLSSAWSYQEVIDALESQVRIPGWQGSRWLQGQLVMVFDSEYNSVVETRSYVYCLHYSEESGLELVSVDRKGEDA